MTKKVTMDLMKFKTVDQAFKTTVMVAVICCLIMGVSFSAAAIYLSNKIDNVLEKHWSWMHQGKFIMPLPLKWMPCENLNMKTI